MVVGCDSNLARRLSVIIVVAHFEFYHYLDGNLYANMKLLSLREKTMNN